MKFLAQICIIIALFSVCLASTENLLEEEPKLRGFIADIFNKTIIDLIASLNETITVAQLPISLGESGIIAGNVNISDLSLTGIKELVAKKIDASVLTLTLDATIEVPKITFFSKYDADVRVLEKIPIFGIGNISATIDKISLKIGGKVNLTAGLSLSNVTVSFTLGKATTFSVLGLLGDDKLSALLTEALNDDLVSFLDDNETLISNFISPIAGKLINDLLSRKAKESVDLHLQELFTADELARIQKE